MLFNVSKKVKFIFFVIALGLTGYFLYPLLANGLDNEKNVIIQLSGPLSMFLLSVALYIDTYIYKNYKENKQ